MLRPGYSLALSNKSGRIVWYATDLVSTGGDADGLPVPTAAVWELVEESATAARAWADAITRQEMQTLTCTARRNGRPVQLIMFPVRGVAGVAIVSIGLWPQLNLNVLTASQLLVCRKLTAGNTAAQIATELGVSISTIHRHRSAAMDKLQARTPEQLGALIG